MCQKLKEQTDQLKTKAIFLNIINPRRNEIQTQGTVPLMKYHNFFSLQVQEFSKRIKQDSLCHLQDRSMVMNLIQFLKSLFGNLT
jgi:hypothetical protein